MQPIKYLLLGSFLCSFIHIYAQRNFQSQIDSLENSIATRIKNKEWQHAITDLHELSNVYELEGDWENYHEVVNRMIKYSEQINDNARLVECYNKLGISNCYMGNNHEAVKQFQKAIDLCQTFDDQDRLSNLFENIAKAYKDLGQYQKGVSFQLQSLELRSGTNNIRIFNNYIALGTLYGLINDTIKQYYYVNKAKITLESQENKDFAQIAIFYNELGDIFEDRGLLDSSIFCYQKVIDNSKQIGWQRGIAVGIGNMAGIYMEMENYSKALELHFNSLELSIKIDDCMSIAEEYLYIAEIYKKTNRIDSALQWNNKAITKSQQCDLRKEFAYALQQQAELYEKKGWYKKAYSYLTQYHALNDSLTGIENKSNIAELESRFQTKEKEQQIELLNAQNQIAKKEKTTQLILFLVSLIILFIALLTFFILFRNKRKIANELEKVTALKSHFFNNISHEFRTPLTLISGPANTLLKNETTSHKKKLLELINNNAARLLNLVNQLLDLSRLDAGQYIINAGKGDLAGLLQKLTSEFDFLAQSKAIHYSKEIGSYNEAWFDPNIVESIITNLLSNAFKYVNNDKRITIRADFDKQNAQIIITNSCDYIADNEIEKLFDRFYRSDNVETGSGIGLALVKELLQVYGGKIQGSYENKQLTIVLNLPINRNHFNADQISEQTAIINQHSTNSYLQKPFSEEKINGDKSETKLLIVEDHEDMRNYIASCFAKYYDIIIAVDGMDGLEKAKREVPDLIISDIMMPRMDGVALCNELKSNQTTSHIPIILLTAKAGEENMLTGLKNKANDYLTKPFKTDILLQKVKNLIEHSRQMRDRYSEDLMIKPLKLVFPSSEDQFARNLQAVINEHLVNPDFNVEQFCMVTNLSRTQLHRKLTSLTGLSATAFIRTQRVKLAANLIQDQKANITDICYSVGFNDTSYFSKCFRELMGESPSEYQAQLTD